MQPAEQQMTVDRSGDEPVLEVRNLVKHFPLTQGIVFKRTIGQIQAVDDVSFSIRPGETLGLVGESGSGKSTVARTLLRLHEPTGGEAFFQGQDLFTMSNKDMRAARRDIQMIFQDPYSSLNPRMTVGDIIAEPWRIHTGILPRNEQRDRVAELLDLVGLNPDHINRFPHQFSGGQRQRIGVARALAVNPSVIIADEPVSALDVSVQAQVVNLLEDIQAEFGIAFLFIAHDLSVVRHIADRVAVMYLGKIIEIGTEEQIYDRPTHPYTQALLSAAPIADPRRRAASERILLQGDLPSPSNPPSGCRFRTRCWLFNQMKEEDEATGGNRTDKCINEPPELAERDYDHPSACHYPQERHIIETVDRAEVTTPGDDLP
ncbi:oligopeptide/dipeptide ABC transporter ATP-binding protein [Salsipaludibacter albus]|uniref:ABC transporter ATP-binding protein n=1 Tax=Salsipaludibacter albus TaxID=2849650 RepID=UPI001EE3EEDC